MDKEELARLPLLNSDLLIEALNDGDKEKALTLTKGLAKEFVAIHKNLWGTAVDLFHFIDDVFRKSQAAMAEDIEKDIENNSFKEAAVKVEEKKEQHLALHDLYLEIIEAIQSMTANIFGEDVLYEALRDTAEKKKFWFENVIKLPVEDLVRHSAELLKMHTGHCVIEEDEEKFTFVMDPCGSGGRLWRNETKGGLGKTVYTTKKPHPQNLMQKGLPGYCAHCPVWNSLLPVEWFGHPLWVFDLPTEPADACRVHIFKDPGNVPEGYYKRLGREKPA